LTIQILAAMAEHEGRLISERTKAGLAAARARGVVFGSKNLTPEARRLGQIAAALARATRTKAAYRDLVPTISSLRASGMSTKVIAVELNAAGQRNQYGRRWNSTAVNNLCRRENIIPLPGIFQRRTSAFREIQERGVIAAKKTTRSSSLRRMRLRSRSHVKRMRKVFLAARLRESSTLRKSQVHAGRSGVAFPFSSCYEDRGSSKRTSVASTSLLQNTWQSSSRPAQRSAAKML
jgi:hypothetical protein